MTATSINILYNYDPTDRQTKLTILVAELSCEPQAEVGMAYRLLLRTKRLPDLEGKTFKPHTNSPLIPLL